MLILAIEWGPLPSPRSHKTTDGITLVCITLGASLISVAARGISDKRVVALEYSLVPRTHQRFSRSKATKTTAPSSSTNHLPNETLAICRFSGQTHYVHESSGKRSFALPGAEQEQAPAVKQSHTTGANRDREKGREGAGARGRCFQTFRG